MVVLNKQNATVFLAIVLQPAAFDVYIEMRDGLGDSIAISGKLFQPEQKIKP
jgi:hypothetical protein